MSDLRELYQQVIIDHGRHPRNFCVCAEANYIKEGWNPLCGDKITIYLTLENDKVSNFSFQGSGCAISMASASLLSEAVKNKTLQEVKQFFADFHQLVTQGNQDNIERLGKLSVLAGVNEYPARVKCATLAWHTLMGAIENKSETITTE